MFYKRRTAKKIISSGGMGERLLCTFGGAEQGLVGGMQLQVTCASKEELLDALVHPEKYESLVVRIGGFSEYFNWLSPVLKQTVIDRTEY